MKRNTFQPLILVQSLSDRKTFKTLKGAKEYAQYLVGDPQRDDKIAVVYVPVAVVQRAEVITKTIVIPAEEKTYTAGYKAKIFELD